jgi:hypothetical protein
MKVSQSYQSLKINSSDVVLCYALLSRRLYERDTGRKFLKIKINYTNNKKPCSGCSPERRGTARARGTRHETEQRIYFPYFIDNNIINEIRSISPPSPTQQQDTRANFFSTSILYLSQTSHWLVIQLSPYISKSESEHLSERHWSIFTPQKYFQTEWTL